MAVEKLEQTPTLAIEGVSHRYGTRPALIDVTFSVAPSTFTVLLGLNGAGKSTLFSLITRLYAVQRGRIRIFGHDVARASSEALRMVGVVFQPRTLDLDLSVIQNLIYHAALHGIGKRQARHAPMTCWTRIALSERANDKVRNLSGGQMRHVEIARALLHQPRLLLLDEPTVGLDIKSRADILGHVRGMVADMASRCCGPRTSSTKSARTMMSSCCIKGGFSRMARLQHHGGRRCSRYPLGFHSADTSGGSRARGRMSAEAADWRRR